MHTVFCFIVGLAQTSKAAFFEIIRLVVGWLVGFHVDVPFSVALHFLLMQDYGTLIMGLRQKIPTETTPGVFRLATTVLFARSVSTHCFGSIGACILLGEMHGALMQERKVARLFGNHSESGGVVRWGGRLCSVSELIGANGRYLTWSSSPSPVVGLRSASTYTILRKNGRKRTLGAICQARLCIIMTYHHHCSYQSSSSP